MELKTYTQEGYQALLNELDFMKAEREKNKKEISEARSFGDLSENSEYDEAKSNQAKIAIRIAELEELIKNAVVQEEFDYSRISVGAIVTVENRTKGKEYVYHIVGSYEADPFNGQVSDESPIGTALRGKKVGEEATVVLPNGTEQILVVKNIEHPRQDNQ